VLCPSDAAGSVREWDGPPNSYRASVGDIHTSSRHWWHGLPEAQRNVWLGGLAGDNRGIFVVGLYGTIDFGGIPDGTSNTLLLSEAAIGTARRANDVKGGIAVVANRTSPGLGTYTSPIIPGYCRDRAGANGRLIGAVATAGGNHSGQRWGDSLNTYTLFHAALPPNSPSCNSLNHRENDLGPLISASSFHSGGVNAALADGSVRFFSETIHAARLHEGLLKDYSGPAIWGIWASLSTRNGGESTTMP